MNTDDPKLTAYALDELDPAGRAEIEQMLRNDPAAAAEMEATRAFAAQLRTRLKAERADGLHPAQRAEVLASVVADRPRNVITFSRRAAVWSALAASVLIGVGWAVIFPALNRVEKSGRLAEARVPNGPIATITDGSQVRVQLAREDELLDAKKVELTPPVTSLPEPPSGSLPLALKDSDGASVGALSMLNLSDPVPYFRGRSVEATAPDSLSIGGGYVDQPAAPSEAPKTATVTANGSFSQPAAKSGKGYLASNDKAGGYRLATVPAKAKALYFTDGESRTTTVRTLRKDRFGDDWDAGISRHTNEAPGSESYDDVTDNPFAKVTDAPLSTFSIDVDTASYANVRRFLNSNQLPPKAAVRIEELVNYFHYDYPQPEGDAPFSSAMEIASCPWAPDHRLLRVALHGRDIARAARPASNLVFLIDVSGSMQPENKLPLLKRSLALMVDQLGDRDRVAIVVYAGSAGCVLESTHNKDAIRAALDRLESGGSTHGSEGIKLAYRLAENHFIKGGTNRVILATDGDWNVGITDKGDLWKMIERKAKSGVFLTVLGFGMDNLKDDMLEKLADKGNGNYAYIDTLNEGRKVLCDELGATLITIAKDVKIQIEFNPAQIAAYRLIGYENRVMTAKDFADDTKDAGEIGAGHSVTALYEIVPAGKALPAPKVEPLKYQPAPSAPTEEKPEIRNPKLESNDELLTLKLRYKAPDAETSTLREYPFKDAGRTFAQSTRDFRFAAAVAGYGMILRDSPHKGTANWALVHELAVEGKGEDRDGYRAEFVGLVEKARAVSR